MRGLMMLLVPPPEKGQPTVRMKLPEPCTIRGVVRLLEQSRVIQAGQKEPGLQMGVALAVEFEDGCRMVPAEMLVINTATLPPTESGGVKCVATPLPAGTEYIGQVELPNLQTMLVYRLKQRAALDEMMHKVISKQAQEP